jgi:O-antigen/teichoic acid export membrane protein
MTSNVNMRIAIGTGWMTGLRLFDRAIALISVSLLARLLLPEDFGLVAYAMTFYGVLESLFQFSFETVLIRDQDSGRSSYNTAWTLNVIKGAVMAVLVIAGAKPIAAFFSEPQLETILYWIAAMPALRGFENIGVVDFQKNMTFNKEFSFHFLTRVLAVPVTVTMALLLRSHWALVYGMLVSAMLRVVFSYVMSDFRPRFELSQFSRVFGFSKWLQFQNVLVALYDRVPAALIGRFHGAQALAYFNIGTELVNVASIEISAPLRRVLFPGIAKIAHDSALMIQTLRASIEVIVFVGLPASVGIGVVAPILVPLVLGDNWTEAIPILQILAANAVVYVILFSNSNVVYLALGRPEITAYQTALRVALIVPAMIVVVPEYGSIGAAWALFAVNTVVMIVDYVIVLRMVPLGLSNVLAALWRSAIATAFMAACVYWVQDSGLVHQEGVIRALALGVSTTIGVLSYSAIVFALWWLVGKPGGAEKYMVDILRRSSRRLVRGA